MSTLQIREKNLILRIMLFLFLCSSVPLSTSTIRTPSAPREPVVDTFEESKKPSGSEAATPVAQGTLYMVEVQLVDGRSIKGRIRIAHEEFNVQHQVDGVAYRRSLHFKELSSMEIVSWAPLAGSQSADQAEQMYYLMPAAYRVISRDGLDVLVTQRFKILDEFLVENLNGKARFYTFFVDYWIGDASSGYWENARSKNFQYVQQNPPGQVVRRLLFIGNE